ncbi:hypothetical protein TNCV_620231 [Trichonephila clavipes]|nr:hypothetical protein TNCV_620231 [Trichonephila clavipes]
MLEKVIENWTSRLDYIRASRGSPMPEIIFKIDALSYKFEKGISIRLTLRFIQNDQLTRYRSRKFPTASLEEFVAVEVTVVIRYSPNYDKDISEFVQSSKNIIDADSDDKIEMNIAAPVPTSSEMRNIMKSMRNYLDAHSNSEMNNKMNDIEQFY